MKYISSSESFVSLRSYKVVFYSKVKLGHTVNNIHLNRGGKKQ